MTTKYILINYTGRKGAGAIFAYEMTKGLIQCGAKVAAIISADIENLYDWENLKLYKLLVISTYSDKLSYIKNSLFFGRRQKKQIIEQFKNDKIDAIYCPMFCPWTNRINQLFKGVPTYDTLHDPKPHSGEKWYVKLSWYKPTKNTSAIIVLSEKHIEYVGNKWGKPVLWIPHGRFNYYKDKYFKGFKASDKINFLFFGRLEHYKGLGVLAEAFKRVQNDMSQFTLTVAGPGNWSEYEKEYVGIRNFNIINEWIDAQRINELYSFENTVTVLPYLDASQSGVIPVAKEYMSPIIASATGGMSEQIIDGETGILVPAGNAEKLAEAIKSVYYDFDKAKEMAKKAWERLDQYNWDKLALKLMENIK